MFKAFKATDNNKLALLSFPRFKPYQIAKVPEFRTTRTTVASHKVKTRNNCVAIAQNWMNHLPMNYSDDLLVSFIKHNPEIVREMIGTHHKNLY